MRSGVKAEATAVEYLVQNGFRVIEQNWRTRCCEIDIVSQKRNTIFFVEVKYRRTDSQGSGIEYITTAKLRQMSFAAEMWVNEHNFDGDYRLAALEVSGDDFQITNFIYDW